MSLRPVGFEGVSEEKEATPRLGLLDGFELDVGGQTVLPPFGVQRLLAFLALHRRALHRTYVSGHLWLELTQERASACLRTTLWRTGRLPCRLVEATSTHLALLSFVVVDVRGLQACAENILAGSAPRRWGDIERLASAGDLLPDWYDDWVIQERDRLRQLRLLALEAASDALIDTRCYRQASVAALAAIATDPLRESAFRLLIRSYLEVGDVAEALRQFSVFRAQLHRDLGLEPSRQMRDLVRGLIA